MRYRWTWSLMMYLQFSVAWESKFKIGKHKGNWIWLQMFQIIFFYFRIEPILNWKLLNFLNFFCFCESIEWYIFEANKFRMNPVWFHPEFIKCLLFKKGQNVEVQVFFTIYKKSTIFVRFYSNFQGLIYPWAGQTLKVWAKLDKNCGFFVNGEENLHFYILTFLK